MKIYSFRQPHSLPTHSLWPKTWLPHKPIGCHMRAPCACNSPLMLIPAPSIWFDTVVAIPLSATATTVHPTASIHPSIRRQPPASVRVTHFCTIYFIKNQYRRVARGENVLFSVEGVGNAGGPDATRDLRRPGHFSLQSDFIAAVRVECASSAVSSRLAVPIAIAPNGSILSANIERAVLLCSLLIVFGLKLHP